MPTLYEIVLAAAALGAGLTAGLCFAFATFIMSALDSTGAERAIVTMQAINTRILRSFAMLVWFGTAFLGAAAIFLAQDRSLPIAATVLYALGAILITGRGNVPLNEELDRVEASGPGSEAAWARYLKLWCRWNTLRTVLLALSTLLFALA